ncbi:MAG TPA: response regulator [Oligoflexus sp.]|uniref:response regulator n=1 Tax=Oligoflexus sp. TaxID=1971216 RepID=UPI002D806E5B|nr:response regulator [Oligoflexus sp.]HET9236121.1 response regulator [Oligoflexus sp.]
MIQKPCLIIAEDSRTIRDQLLFFLKLPELDVLPAEDGLEALALFDANQDRVRMVLTDIHMPNLEGLELSRILREDRRFTGPIIVLTQQGDNAMIKRAKELGVNGWLIKPFKGDELLQIIKRVLLDHEKKKEVI